MFSLADTAVSHSELDTAHVSCLTQLIDCGLIANVHSMCDTFLPALFNFAINVLKTIFEVLIIAYGNFHTFNLLLHMINKNCLTAKFSA